MGKTRKIRLYTLEDESVIFREGFVAGGSFNALDMRLDDVLSEAGHASEDKEKIFDLAFKELLTWGEIAKAQQNNKINSLVNAEEVIGRVNYYIKNRTVFNVDVSQDGIYIPWQNAWGGSRYILFRVKETMETIALD